MLLFTGTASAGHRDCGYRYDGCRAGYGQQWSQSYCGPQWSQSYYGDSMLRAVWGTAPDDVWAVGEDLVVVHWDGAKWTSRELPP